MPAGWSSHHQWVPFPIEENPLKSSFCLSGRALPVHLYPLGCPPGLGRAGFCHSLVDSEPPAFSRIAKQAMPPEVTFGVPLSSYRRLLYNKKPSLVTPPDLSQPPLSQTQTLTASMFIPLSSLKASAAAGDGKQRGRAGKDI